MRIYSALVALATLAAAAAPATAATTSAVTSVNVVKPVSMSKIQDMDFGTLTFAGFTGTRSIVLSRLGGVTCATDIVCGGATRQARFNVQGTNKLVVLLTYTSGSLSNGSDTIPFTADGQSSVTLTNTGAPGNNFDVSGTITVSSTTVGGVYAGTMTVTGEYQ